VPLELGDVARISEQCRVGKAARQHGRDKRHRLLGYQAAQIRGRPETTAMAPGCGAAAGSAVGGAERGYAATRLLRREMCRRTRFRTFFLVGAIGTHLNPLEEHAQEQLLPGLLDGAIDRPAVRVPKMGEQHGVARSVQTLRLQCPADPQAETTLTDRNA
jgi:hypothetical protein